MAKRDSDNSILQIVLAKNYENRSLKYENFVKHGVHGDLTVFKGYTSAVGMDP